MREIFGNPSDGTFLAWFADGGVWAVIIVVGALIGWLVARRVTRRLRDGLINLADESVRRMQLDYSVRDHRRFYIFLTDLLIGGVIMGTAAALGSLSVLGVNIDPALDALADIGRGFRGWWAGNGVQIAIIIVLAVVVSKMLERTIPRLMRAFV
ncbi:MAG: hypothetical protein IH868_11020, partial [Chloroflexi bacterium]|nr:hypothetical protein [Chloroflexota bacterium]